MGSTPGLCVVQVWRALQGYPGCAMFYLPLYTHSFPLPNLSLLPSFPHLSSSQVTITMSPFQTSPALDSVRVSCNSPSPHTSWSSSHPQPHSQSSISRSPRLGGSGTRSCLTTTTCCGSNFAVSVARESKNSVSVW